MNFVLGKLRRTLKKLSNPDTPDTFKITFSLMVAIALINAICFYKNMSKNYHLMSIFNAVTCVAVGYNSLYLLMAILKKQYMKKILDKVCVNLLSLVTYLLCPLYIVIAFMANRDKYVFPIGLIVLILHFFILPHVKKRFNE